MEYMFIILIMVLVVAAFLSKKLKTISRNTTHEKQLKYIEEAVFSKKNVMNISEGHLYEFLTHMIHKYKYPLRVFPQVSLGEILKTESNAAFFSVNSKRVDFVIAGIDNEPFAVIEYQGAGHYQNNARKRDLIKRISCEKAGIKYFEVPAKYTGNELKPVIDFFEFIKEKHS
ncbi:DUF2726 domain-containing protein [Salmonella enterica subsp. enterica serovar Enteritidis]|uniref:DUF2726 domain-containing protein n=1 Tax=Citrobacter freundii TaxID=546 RepID=UPI001D676C67|nr:DUF2726 domain-containing protein [Citrobacter freundii]EDE0699061.1 DUF2726 domain-containing protein [Salmonella enterica subsp. enterica serovar Enteritidis]EHE8248395.1 DUF2726 domain-containing protein [Escherichia coli]ELM7745848.1 DUF2726 domain-containing protein [Escherichia coli]ELM7794060.1 DUF2726 domain-containing protein [Escherichia coli]